VSEPAWRVELAPAAQRQLRKLPSAETARLRAPILALAGEPRPPGAIRLAGTSFWRLRTGGLRVVHALDEDRRLVVVLRAARRGESTYRRVR
jgi:mRNA interferase RelE/StbE